MLKNKMIIKKIRNIFILLMAIIIMIGVYANIRNSKAENVIEVELEVADNNNQLETQTVIATATETRDGSYLLDLPTSVNKNIVTKYYTADGAEVEMSTENSDLTLELTEAEVAEQKVQLKSDYDTKEVIVNDETKVFYNKELKNDETEEVIVTGYMPLNAELEVKPIDLNSLTSVKLPNQNQTMQKAYEMSLFEMVEKQVEENTETNQETQTNENGETTPSTEGIVENNETILEQVEYDPSVYGEKITIKVKREQTDVIVTAYSLTEDNQVVKIESTTEEYTKFEVNQTGKYIIATEIQEISVIEKEPDTMNNNSNSSSYAVVASNVLKSTSGETTADSTFLGNVNIQRKNIENITFVSSVADANSTAWDVSAAGDNSVMAWYEITANGTYKVYIGSNGEIVANTDSSYLFFGIGSGSNCSSKELITNLNLLKTNEVEKMSYMFASIGRSALEHELKLQTSFNVSMVTDMSYMFSSANLKTLEFVGFYPGRAKDMNHMFYNLGVGGLETLDLGQAFDTRSVTDMSYMFGHCGAGSTKMKTLNLGNSFYTDSVTDMTYMFGYCGAMGMTTLDLGPAFTKIADQNTNFILDNGKAGELVINVPESIYNDETHLKLNTSSETTIEHTRGTVNPKYITEWIKDERTIDETNKTITVKLIGKTNEEYGYASSQLKAILTRKIKVFKDGTDITSEVTKSVGTPTTSEKNVLLTVTISNYPTDANVLELQIGAGTLEDVYGNKNRDNNIAIYSTLKTTNTETEDTSGFLGNTSIQRANIENVTFVSSTANANSTAWDVSAAGDNSIIAWYETQASGAIKVYIGSEEKIRANTNSSSLFSRIGMNTVATSEEIITNIELLNTNYVTDMSYMFDSIGWNAMTTLDLGSNFYTSNVTNMEGMFNNTGMFTMTTLDLGGHFDTSNVKNMSYMFEGCGYHSLESLDLGDRFYTTNVSDMNNMFTECGIMKMTTLDLGPVFSPIPSESGNLIYDCGKSGAVIYAPEAIYQDITHLKLNTNSTTTIEYTRGTINPKYKTVWELEDTQGVGRSMKITLRGTTNPEVVANEYASDVTSTLKAENIKVFIDGTDITKDVNISVGTPTQTTNTVTNAKDVLQDVTISGFRQESYQKGKQYVGWSGNITLQIDKGTLQDSCGNSNLETQIKDDEELNQNTRGKMFADYAEPAFKMISSNIKNNTEKTITYVFNITDKYYSTEENNVMTEDDVIVYVDQEAAEGITKTITKEPITETRNDKSVLIGYKYTLVLSNFEQNVIKSEKNFKEWSGKVSIYIAAKAIKDMSNNRFANTDLKNYGSFQDYIKPDIIYRYAGTSRDTSPSENPEINYDTKTLKVVFDITDKYYNAPITAQEIEEQKLTLNDLTIKIDGVEPDWTKVERSLKEEDAIATGPLNKTIDGTVQTGLTGQVIGKRYTLTLSGLQQEKIESGSKTLDYSGVVTIGIPANKIKDTSNNYNIAKTITVGTDLPEETGSDQIVDVVNPIWEKTASAANLDNQTATIIVRGTDKYFAESTLTKEKIKILANGEIVTNGLEIRVNKIQDLKEERIVNGVTTQVQYGIMYAIEISGYPINANTLKMQIQSGTIKDQSENTNEDFYETIYSTLKTTNTEIEETSGFLGNTNIQRANIENVTFVSSTKEKNDTEWDVSAVGDNSIIAWYETQASGALKVYIGSEGAIKANANSSSLFSCIGVNAIAESEEVITNIRLLNTKYVTDMSYMFYQTGHNAMTTLNLGSNFYTSNVTNMEGMFMDTGRFEMTTLELGGNFDTSRVENMSYMFNGCGSDKLNSLDLGGNFNTSSVTDMENMFSSMISLTSLNLGDNFNTSSVTNMDSMFFEMISLTSLNLGGNFNTSQVENMNYMFNDMSSLTSLDLGDNFDTSSVRNGMSGMFGNMSSLTSLNLGSNFNTSNVSNMNSMFFGMQALTNLELGDQFDTSNVTSMQSMFRDMTSLTSLNLKSKFDTKKVTDMRYMFYNMTSLTSLDLGPAFTQIASTHGLFVTNCGTAETIIYAPEAIYNDRTHFKLNANSTTTIEYTPGTINPKYRTVWEKAAVTPETGSLIVVLGGKTNPEVPTSEYDSTVTSKITTGNVASSVKVFIDDVELTNVTKTLLSSSGSTSVIRLANFEEAVRQAGKKYKEWSGNITLKVAAKTLEDKYGNQNLGRIDTTGEWVDIEIKDETTVNKNTSGSLFADFIKPEFTYEYSETVIDQDTKTLTAVFYAADKYYDAANSSLVLSDLELRVDGERVYFNEEEGDSLTAEDLPDGTGVKYTLVVKNLPRNTGNPYYDYSGPVSITIPADKIVDYSENKNNRTTITIGQDSPTNHPEHNTDVIVDFVDPVWRAENVQVSPENRNVSLDLIITDKYFKECIITPENVNDYITVLVNSVNMPMIVRTITEIENITDIRDGENVTIGVRYNLVLSGWDNTNETGSIMIRIEKDTAIDQYENKSGLTYLPLVNIDLARPEVDPDTITWRNRKWKSNIRL